ncbi:MAG: T9SS type A sorting domain-containing protein [Bacteroidales bacterium]|nr:T9SS type A sorting domain-containing protein [Bacteroidales bacterium]
MLSNKNLSVFLIVFIFLPHVLKGQSHLIQAYKIATISKSSLNYIPGVPAQFDVDMYYISYHTTDAHGHTTLASGAFMLPVTDSCNFFPLMSFQHGTVLKKNDVPSRNNGEAMVGQIFASLGYIACMPDYLGLGDGIGLHPYLHAETQANATIDLMRACREYINDSLEIYDNGQVFLAGYSQGGHATMAAHKKIQDAQLEQEFNIIASAPGSGPYYLSGAQSEMVFLAPDYSRPGYIVFLICAYNDAYQNLFNHPSEIFKSPYDSLIPIYLNGNYSMSQLNNILPDSLHKFLQDSVYQAIINDFDNKTLPFWQNMVANDNYNWNPQAPIKMYYCEADEQVSYLNATNAFQAMTDSGSTTVEAINLNPSYNHGSCSNPYIYMTVLWFNSLKIPCTNTNHINADAERNIRIHPNPITNFISISGHQVHDKILIYNALGQPIYSAEAFSTDDLIIRTEHLSAGLYFISIINTSGLFVTQKIVK